MNELFDRYFKYLEARHASKYTVRNYKDDLLGARGLVPFLKLQGIEELRQVSKHTLRDYVACLLGQGIVKASINRKISAVRSFYRWLRLENMISAEELPLSISRKRGSRASSFSLKLDKRLPELLSLEEAADLVETPDLTKPEGLRDRALLELLYATGLRVSELASLDTGQVNLDTRELMVRGKGSKVRVVLMGKPAAAALVHYISEGRPQPRKERSSDALFLNPSGSRLSVRQIQRILGKYAHKAGIDRRVHPHMVRHTFATHMLDRGADLRVVQELLGHADLSSTQIYTQVTRTQARKVYLSAHPLAGKSDGLKGKA